ncbi:Fur family manganese uptake regulator [Pacificibacter maritimus]|uniref:Ferric uptake regulation protein n=1 Tax=Pacificibacter maritimus TaxID=762213 RepID=A0A3N4VEF7_9RHOB|nr:Fur family transcriptional regulator [Pacificibacter maritimus]RPE71314.1 Fur family manganese uptake regulator [Pacificibacter maritimus]
MTDTILDRCKENGMRMTGQRKIIAQVLDQAKDHPAAEELFKRAAQIDPHISLATVYRTVKTLEDCGILAKVDFGDGRARYEPAARAHHDHLIDVDTGRVIEFVDHDIEALQEKIATKLGYRLTGHRLELFGVKIHPDTD